jgi:sec-independent protein translocase protein TatA
MGGFSAIHWMVVLLVVLLLFGNRLPSVMRSLGRGVTEFKKGLEGVGGEADDEVEAAAKKEKIEKQTAEKVEKPA